MINFIFVRSSRLLPAKRKRAHIVHSYRKYKNDAKPFFFREKNRKVCAFYAITRNSCMDYICKKVDSQARVVAEIPRKRVKKLNKINAENMPQNKYFMRDTDTARAIQGKKKHTHRGVHSLWDAVFMAHIAWFVISSVIAKIYDLYRMSVSVDVFFSSVLLFCYVLFLIAVTDGRFALKRGISRLTD